MRAAGIRAAQLPVKVPQDDITLVCSAERAVTELRASVKFWVKRRVFTALESLPFSIRKVPLRVSPVICKARGLTKLV